MVKKLRLCRKEQGYAHYVKELFFQNVVRLMFGIGLITKTKVAIVGMNQKLNGTKTGKWCSGKTFAK